MTLLEELRPWLILSLFIHLLFLSFVKTEVSEAWRQQLQVMQLELNSFDAQKEKRQVVEAPAAGREMKPKNARFLSERNQTVEKESVGPLEKMHRSGVDVAERKKEVKSETTSKKQDEKKISKTTNAPGIGPLARRDSAQGQIPQGSENDYFPNVPQGEGTYINAEAFEHTGYYLEIKRKIEITWSPQTVLRRLWSRGEGLPRSTVRTILGVTLVEDGGLFNVVILEPSGLDDLDREALRAFRASAPFTRAPEPLLSPDRKLRFEFGFVITQ